MPLASLSLGLPSAVVELVAAPKKSVGEGAPPPPGPIPVPPPPAAAAVCTAGPGALLDLPPPLPHVVAAQLWAPGRKVEHAADRRGEVGGAGDER